MRSWCIAGLLALCLGLSSFHEAPAAPPLSVYGALPGFERASLSPSGKRTAILGTIGNKRQLIVTENGKIIWASTLGNDKVRRIDWAGENRVMLMISATERLSRIDFLSDRVELYTMLVVPLDGGEPWYVFGRKNDVAGGIRGYYGVRERNGHWYGYFGGMTMEREAAGKGAYVLMDTSAELYEVDLANGDSTRIASRASGEVSRDWLVGADGKVAATVDFASNHGDWRIRNRNGKIVAEGVNRLGGIELLALGATPDTIVYAQDDETSETRNTRWFEIPQAGGQPREILADERILSPVVDHLTGQMIGYERDQDLPEIRMLSARPQKIISAVHKAFPGLNLELIDWSTDFGKLLVRTDGEGDAGTWWVVDIESGGAEVIGSTYAIAPADVGQVRTIAYKAADGLDMSGVLTLPPGRPAKNLPIIVLPHGGPHARDYPTFDWWPQALASRGYAVFQPNFRGSTGFGPAFQQAGKGEWGGKMQSDISDGLAELVRQGLADPKRACIVGASYGGYAALAGVTLQHGLYRCAVSVAGIGDLSEYYNNMSRMTGGDQTLLRYLRDDMGAGELLKRVSPINYVDRIDAPILLIHGKDDVVVPYLQSTRMASALTKADKSAQLVMLEGEDHWLSRGETRLKMLEAIVTFVERHNPPL